MVVCEQGSSTGDAAECEKTEAVAGVPLLHNHGGDEVSGKRSLIGIVVKAKCAQNEAGQIVVRCALS